MPLWSLTMERLERLKQQIAAKKAEYDELEALSEKDLWIRDLDALMEEWENQLKLDDEIQTNIRRMGRRVSKKIGAGGKGGKRANKQDDDYAPVARKAKAAPIKKEKVVETKTHQRFAEMFGAKPKAKAASKAASPVADSPAEDHFYSDEEFAGLAKTKKPAEPVAATNGVVNGRTKRAAASKAKAFLIEDDDEDLSDDDFASLEKTTKPAPASRSVSAAPKDEVVSSPAAAPDSDDITMEDAPEKAPTPPAEALTKRAAASKAKTWVVDSDSDDDNMLGDVGALVKGIGAPAIDSKGGRLSLYAMSQSGGANGSTLLPKVKAKSSRNFDIDSMDDTNYEALAMSSPHKSTKGNDIDEFLSDDDLPPPSKVTASKASSQTAKPLAIVPTAAKKRGRPAGTKNKQDDNNEDAEEPVVAKPKAKPAPKPRAKPAAAAAKPAAKPAASAKPVTLSPAAKAYAKKKAAKAVVISDDEDEDDDMEEVSAPAPAPAARGRPGRAAAAKAKTFAFSTDEEDESFDAGGKDDDKDDYGMDDSSEF